MCEAAERGGGDVLDEVALDVLDSDLQAAQREVERARRWVDKLRGRLTAAAPAADQPPGQ